MESFQRPSVSERKGQMRSLHSAIWFFNKKESREKLWKHAAWKKNAVTRCLYIIGSVYLKCLDQANTAREKVEWWLLRAGENGGVTVNEYRLSFLGCWKIPVLILVIIVKLHGFNENVEPTKWIIRYANYTNRMSFKKNHPVVMPFNPDSHPNCV